MNQATEINNKGGDSNSKDRSKRKPRRMGGCRRMFFLLVVLSICIIFCGLTLILAWVSGYGQNAVCKIVTENSPAYESINCKNIQKNNNEENTQTTGEDFPVTVAEEENTAYTPATGSIDVTQIYEKTIDSIVGIGVQGNASGDDEVIGSGFVISSNGLIATNQHVVSARDAKYFVKFEGGEELVQVKDIYRDEVNDIAVLKVDKTNLKALTIGLSDRVKPGEPVVAIGNPLGELSSTVTAGIVSAVNRQVSIDRGSFLRTNIAKFEDAIQTDAAINPGNSGGPLLNARGQVIGINFATVQGYDNLSFAIPVSYLEKRLEELNEYGKFRIAYIGLQYRNRLVPLGEEVYVGAEIVALDPKGSAAEFLKSGDIIISFNDEELDGESLSSLIQRSEVGDEVEIGIVRMDAAGKSQKSVVKVKIIESPES